MKVRVIDSYAQTEKTVNINSETKLRRLLKKIEDEGDLMHIRIKTKDALVVVWYVGISREWIICVYSRKNNKVRRIYPRNRKNVAKLIKKLTGCC